MAQSGTIELNGERVGIEALEPALADLVRRKGVVLYGRDAPEGEPHPNAMKVVEMVVANRLPIRMSTMRDYADAIGPDGKLTQ